MNFQNFVKNIDTKLESGLITEANDSKKISFVKDWKKTVGNKLSQGVRNWKQSVSDQWTKGDPITPSSKLRNLRDIFLTGIALSGAVGAKDALFPPDAAPYEHVIDRNRDSAVELLQNDLKNKGFNVRPETLKKVYDETPKEEMDKVLQHMRQYNILAEGVGDLIGKAGEKVLQNPAVRQKAYAAFMATVVGLESMLGMGAEKATKEVVPTVVRAVEKAGAEKAGKVSLADIEAQMGKNVAKAPEKMTASDLLKKSMDKSMENAVSPAEKATNPVVEQDVKSAVAPAKIKQEQIQKAKQEQIQKAKQGQIQKEQEIQKAKEQQIQKAEDAAKQRIRARDSATPFRVGDDNGVPEPTPEPPPRPPVPVPNDDDDYIYPLQPNGEGIDAGDLTTDIKPFSKWASATVQSLKI